MAPARVLISGSGVAGPIVAMQLARAGVRPTVVERASSLRTAGQTLDINGFARELIRKLGTEEAIRTACTGEQGTHIVDASNRLLASLPVGFGPTNEYEIVRHRLCKVFYDASKESTEYRFGDSIQTITQTDKEALVEFDSGRQEAFDAVILADGLGSRARSLVFEPEAVKFDPVGACTAYFSISPLPQDAPWSRLWTTSQRRCLWLRPAPAAPPELSEHTLACFLVSVDSSNQHMFANYRSLGTHDQKQVWEKLFRGAGWQTDRVLDEMATAEDFYGQEMAQVKIQKWHRGRVVVVGDAASCPSPMSGMGTSSAVVGAYVLGQELAKVATSMNLLEDVTKAFENYDIIVRPYVERKQSEVIPPWVRRLVFPESALGVKILQTVMIGVGWVANREVVQRWAKKQQDEEDEGLVFVEGSDEVQLSTLR